MYIALLSSFLATIPLYFTGFPILYAIFFHLLLYHTYFSLLKKRDYYLGKNPAKDLKKNKPVT